MRFLTLTLIISSSYYSCTRGKHQQANKVDTSLAQANANIESLRKNNLVNFLVQKNQLEVGLNHVFLVQPSKCNVCSTKALDLMQSIGDSAKSNILIVMCKGEDYTIYEKIFNRKCAKWIRIDDKTFSELGLRMAENWYLKVLDRKIISHLVVE
jgi:hypothetical protein